MNHANMVSMYLFYNPRLNNIYNNGSISYINSPELEEVSEYDINKFPKDSRFICLLMDLDQMKYYLLLQDAQVYCLELKMKIVVSCGFEKHLIAHNIDDEYKGRVKNFNADFVMLNDLSDLEKVLIL